MGRQIVMLRGKPTGQGGTTAIGGLSPYDRVRTRRRRLEALARPLCRSNSDAAEIQTVAGAFDLLLAMVTVPLDLPAFISALASNGRMQCGGRHICTRYRRLIKMGAFME